LRSVTIQEQLSRLFQIQAELVSENAQLDLDDVVGHPATIRLDADQGSKRFFHGVVSRLVQTGNLGQHARYRATIVPWLWYLTRTTDCRIFQDQTVPDIIEAVFKLYGFADYQLKLTATYPQWNTASNTARPPSTSSAASWNRKASTTFSSTRTANTTLVLADSISAHKASPGYAEVPFHVFEQGIEGKQVVTDWTLEKSSNRQIRPHRFRFQETQNLPPGQIRFVPPLRQSRL